MLPLWTSLNVHNLQEQDKYYDNTTNNTISILQVKKQHVCIVIPMSTASLSDWTGLCSLFSGGPSFS